MDDRQKSFGDLHIASFCDSAMKKAEPSERCVAAPVIGNDGCSWRDVALDKSAQRFGATIRHHGEPDTASVSSRSAFIETVVLLALPNLDRASHEYHAMKPMSLAARAPANVGLISLDDFTGFSSDPILVGAHHADTQFVEYLECSLVTRQSKLPLKLNSRHALRLAGHQVSGPEPDSERRVRMIHDCVGSKAGFASTPSATENAGASGVTIGIANCLAVGADKPATPSSALKVSRTRCLIRKEPLKLRERFRKWQIVSLQHINDHVRPKFTPPATLQVVAVCDNRISTFESIDEQRNYIQCTFGRADAWIHWSDHILTDKPLVGLLQVFKVGAVGYWRMFIKIPGVDLARATVTRMGATLVWMLPRTPKTMEYIWK